MNIDPEVIAKWLALGAGFGTTFAGIKPFAERLFNHWIAGREEEAKARRDEQQRTLRALEHSTTVQERTVGVLENLHERQTRSDARLDRIENHLGITINPSAVPPEPTPVGDVRGHVTGSMPAVTIERASVLVKA